MISLSLHISWPCTWSIRRHGLLGQAPPDETRWKKMHCLPFLDSESSRLPWRAFYVSKTAVEASELDERIRVYLNMTWISLTMSIDWFNSSSLFINASLTARFAGSQTFFGYVQHRKSSRLAIPFLEACLTERFPSASLTLTTSLATIASTSELTPGKKKGWGAEEW